MLRQRDGDGRCTRAALRQTTMRCCMVGYRCISISNFRAVVYSQLVSGQRQVRTSVCLLFQSFRAIYLPDGCITPAAVAIECAWLQLVVMVRAILFSLFPILQRQILVFA